MNSDPRPDDIAPAAITHGNHRGGGVDARPSRAKDRSETIDAGADGGAADETV